mgnify:CR=1 FL=1
MEREQSLKFMHDLLRALVARRGSDLFITAGFPPAMKVDATAPIPGVRTPSLPVAGAICRAFISVTISDRSLDAHIVKQILCILHVCGHFPTCRSDNSSISSLSPRSRPGRWQLSESA